MLKDFPVLIRGPKLAENAEFLFYGFPSLALTLSNTGLRLPLDQRHAGNDSGDGGLRTQETRQLLARIQKEEAEQEKVEPDGACSPLAPKGAVTHTDDWLTERLGKFQPSFSARRDTTFSLNRKVEVDGEEVVCRHIAALWEEEFLRTTGKPSYQTFSSPTALQRAARPMIQSEIITPGSVVGERIHRAQYWMSNDWGQVLTENFSAMSRQPLQDGAVCRTLYLVTPNHAMALGLKIKDDAGARRYVVQLYDPNNTVAHKRSAVTATPDQAGVPAEIRKLKQHDFLPAYLHQRYRLVDADNRSRPTLFFGEKMEPGASRFAGDLPDLDGHVMRYMLKHNLPEQLHAYAGQIKPGDDITRFEILTSRDHHGLSGLYHALLLGHAEAITALGEFLKACQPPLSPAQLMVLFSATCPVGDSGLYVALHQGHAEAVKAFGKLLKACEPPLSSEQLMTLLSAEGSDGLGLHAALQNGHDEAVKVFVELLAACQPTLSTEQIFKLLSAAQSVDDTPGLLAALRHASFDTIVALGKVLTTYQPALSSEQLADLLLSKNFVTGLNIALNSGDTAKIRAFGEILKTYRPSLSAAQLMGLLSATDSLGISGLDSAIQKGHTATIEAFSELLKDGAATLTPEQFMDLLKMEPPDGLPALYTALFKGDAKWIKTYGKLLESVAPSLPSEQLAKLLGTDNEMGLMVLDIASKNGHVEALAAFEALRLKFAPHA